MQRRSRRVKMYCLGIDIGSSSVKLVAVGEDRTILLTRQLRHGGDALACLAGLLPSNCAS